MAEAILALRGWHPALSRAEAIAMFPEAVIKRTNGHRLLTMSGETDYSRATILSGTEAVLTKGGISQWESVESLIRKIDFILIIEFLNTNNVRLLLLNCFFKST